jgi:LysM repeat protein
MAPRKVRHYWALVSTLLLMLVLALSACERQLQDQGNDVIPETGTVEEPEQPASDEQTGEEVAAPAEEDAGEGEEAEADGPIEGIPSDDPEPVEPVPATTEESPRPADEGSAEGEAEEPAAVAEEEAETEGGAVEEAAETGEAAEEEVAEETATEGEEAAAEEATEAEEEVAAAEAETETEAAADENEVIHVVQVGENLYRIGLQYGISWVALATHNNLPNANAIYVGQELKIPTEAGAPGGTPTPTPQPPAETSYVVQAGDTLYRIGQLYNISWVQIAEANGLVNPNQIYVGQELKIPGSAPAPAPQLTHTVQPNETLFLISLHYGVPWLTIANENNLSAPYVIYPGQTLVIPASS